VKLNRRTFLAGMAAATGAMMVPCSRARAAASKDSYATLIDLTRCDGCSGEEVPLCVGACRTACTPKFPEPDPAKLKDYWPQPFHEDWSGRRDITDRLTPYNWSYVQRVSVDVDGRRKEVAIPRRCMHCDNPPCVKLCPFGTNKKTPEGPVHIDPDLCFGGAKCRTVCPWHVPQRQAGVGIYTHLDPLPVGGGVMYKCDLCRDRLALGEQPACLAACPRQAMHLGTRREIEALADDLVARCQGHLYGRTENGGTSTFYVSPVPFEELDRALLEQAEDPKKVMRLHQPENLLERHTVLAKAALVAPVAGAVGAFAATVIKNRDDEK